MSAMLPSRRGSVLVTIDLMVGFLGPAVLSVPAAGAPSTAVVPADSWAYGTQRWFNLSVTTPNGVHVIQAEMSWYTIFTRTNISASVTQLSVDRTVASTFTSSYCSPNCTAPSVEVLLSHSTYEHAVGFLNLTRDATVYEDGTAVAAIGILDTSASASGRVTSSANITVDTPQGIRHVTEAYNATGQAAAHLAFDPALGLLPTSLNVGDSWNSSSTYTGGGTWSVAWSYTKTDASGTTTSDAGSPSGSLNVTGTVTVEGAVVGSMTLPSGTVLPAVTLEFSSSLDVLDGVIFLPHGGGFLDLAGAPWGSDAFGVAHMETHRLAVQFSGDFTSFQLRAASSYYGTDDSAPEMGDQMQGNPHTMVAEPSATSTGVPTTEVTAAPMAVTDARTASDCLAAGTCTTNGTPSGGSEFPWLYVGIGLVVVAAVAIGVSYVLVTRRPSK